MYNYLEPTPSSEREEDVTNKLKTFLDIRKLFIKFSNLLKSRCKPEGTRNPGYLLNDFWVVVL
jgi:hypothetical protein